MANIKVSDYIVEKLIEWGVSDVFGYPGGVICHFIDSLSKYENKITNHTNYHEQAAAFAACGFAQERKGIGVAYSTSGPGATNLITGVANAFFDSIPVIFFTGQVDTYALRGDLPIRQKGFQETDIVSIMRPITKYSVRIDNPLMIEFELEKAYQIATKGNPGPVVLDLPADVQRAEVDDEELVKYCSQNETYDYDLILSNLRRLLSKSSRPCFLLGNGIKQNGLREKIKTLLKRVDIPVVTSMAAFDLLEYHDPHNMGFVGANGHRYANFTVGKADLIICIGTRLDLKQVGNKREIFAPTAKLVRIDIDEGNLKYKVRDDEVQFQCDIVQLLEEMQNDLKFEYSNAEWLNLCREIKNKLIDYDISEYTELVKGVLDSIPENMIITGDVGQSEVWIAQYLNTKKGQTVHMSLGHGSMGYSLPAAIGSHYPNCGKVCSINGDGGIQMNIQELQFIVREQLPIKILIINNRALGMIRGFQEANFNKNYCQTVEGKGYSNPSFERIAFAYGLNYCLIEDKKDIDRIVWDDNPGIIELKINVETTLNPNFGANGVIQDQRPYLKRELFEELMLL